MSIQLQCSGILLFYYFVILDSNFKFKILCVDQIQKKLSPTYALPSIPGHGKNKQVVITKCGQLIITLFNKTQLITSL